MKKSIVFQSRGKVVLLTINDDKALMVTMTEDDFKSESGQVSMLDLSEPFCTCIKHTHTIAAHSQSLLKPCPIHGETHPIKYGDVE